MINSKTILPQCCILFIAGLLLSGCAGISFMEFQDAETLGENNTSLGVATSAGVSLVELYKDTTRALNRRSTSWNVIEVNCQTALAENMDIGVSLWNSSLLSYFDLTKNVRSNSDIGGKINLKRRITPQGSRRNVALGVTILGQFAQYEKDNTSWKSSIFGIAPEVIYSRNVYEPRNMETGGRLPRLFNVLHSLYAGFKTYFIFTNLHYQYPYSPFNIHLMKYPILYTPFVGVSLGEGKSDFIELQIIIMKNPYTGETDFMPYLGAGTKYFF